VYPFNLNWGTRKGRIYFFVSIPKKDAMREMDLASTSRE